MAKKTTEPADKPTKGRRWRNLRSQARGGKIKRYIDPSVISDPAKRKEVELALLESNKVKPKRATTTVRLVLYDGKIREWEIEV